MSFAKAAVLNTFLNHATDLLCFKRHSRSVVNHGNACEADTPVSDVRNPRPGCFFNALELQFRGIVLRRSARTVREVTTSDCVCLVLPGCSLGVSAEQVLLREARHSLHFLACHAGSTCA